MKSLSSAFLFFNKHQTNCLHHGQARSIAALIDSDIKSFELIPAKKSTLIPRSWNLVLSGGPAYLHEHCDKLHRELGPIYRERLGRLELVFLADTRLMQTVISHEGRYPHHNVPEAWLLYNEVRNIERGLFFQVGEPWAKLRKAFNKVMLADHKNISRFSLGIYDVSSQFLDEWERKGLDCVNNEIIIKDIKTELCKWSLETTGFILFGNRMGCVPEPDGGQSQARRRDSRGSQLVGSVEKMFNETSKFQTLPCRLAQRLNLPAWRRFEKASDDMLQIAADCTNEFIGKPTQTCTSSKSSSIVQDLVSLNQLSWEEISRSIIDLIIASADTTSNAVQWMLYLIAKHPDVQSKLLAEVEPLLSNFKSTDWDNWRQSAPYLNAFIREALRLYPTAPFLARTLDHEISLDGYQIPAGKPIVFSLYSTSRMEKYFDNPLEFKPERWMRNSRHSGNVCAFASLPFGIGARMCIGRRAAEIEMSLLIASFVCKFHSKLAPNMQDIKIKLNMTLGPDKPISLVLSPR